MLLLESFEIEGFWGEYDIKKKLNRDVNIFIGRNGTGKTTLINILQAALTVDLPLLENEQFAKINLRLASGKTTRKITVMKEEEFHHEILEYKIGTNKFTIPVMAKELGFRHRKIHPRFIEELDNLKSYMDRLVNVSWLSVHREIMEEPERERYHRPGTPPKSPVDYRLNELMERFTKYQLKLESEASECSAKFQRDVLLSMLYDRTLDSSTEIKDYDLQLIKEKKELSRAFKEFGIPKGDFEKRLDEHFGILRKRLTKVQQSLEKNKPMKIDDVLPIPLLKRTAHIVNLSRAAEKEKRDIFKKRTAFLELLHSFAKDKEFARGSGGELIVKIIDSGKELSIKQLSSGEKQLLILLTETLLQENNPFIFIADEPELSLHVEWQEKLLGAIREMNNSAQLILATHSPEIVAEFNNSTFDMEALFHDHTTSHK